MSCRPFLPRAVKKQINARRERTKAKFVGVVLDDNLTEQIKNLLINTSAILSAIYQTAPNVVLFSLQMNTLFYSFTVLFLLRQIYFTYFTSLKLPLVSSKKIEEINRTPQMRNDMGCVIWNVCAPHYYITTTLLLLYYYYITTVLIPAQLSSSFRIFCGMCNTKCTCNMEVETRMKYVLWTVRVMCNIECILNMQCEMWNVNAIGNTKRTQNM